MTENEIHGFFFFWFLCFNFILGLKIKYTEIVVDPDGHVKYLNVITVCFLNCSLCFQNLRK